MFTIKPVVCAACGAAFSYYCLFPLYRAGAISIDVLLALLFIPAAFLCFLRALSSLKILISEDLTPMPATAGSHSGTATTEEEIENVNSLSYKELSQKQTSILRTNRLSPCRRAAVRWFSYGVAAFAAGMAVGIAAGANSQDTARFNIPENTVTGVSGVLLDDPRIFSGGNAMSTLSLKMSTGKGGVKVTSQGQIIVFFREDNAGRLKEFGRGTEIFAEGTLRGADTGGGSDRTDYIFTAQALHITKTAPRLERFRTGLRLGLTGRFTDSPRGGATTGGDAWGGLALALLLGIRDNLDSGFAAQYRGAGCSYILALSGMHLAIIVSLISFLLNKPLGLRAASILGAVIIIAYCFIVGPLPSLNRAALMYLLGVISILGMLKRDMLSLLCMAFLIQIIAAPKSGFSLSFILSYLALAGILVIGRAISGVFMGKIPVLLLQPLSASLGAFIATAGVSAWFFSDLHPAGILAGLALAPLATVFMVLSIAWLAFDFIIPPLSFLLGKALSLLYLLMEEIAALAAAAPGIRANPFLVLFISLLITVTIIWLDRRRRITAGADSLEPFT